MWQWAWQQGEVSMAVIWGVRKTQNREWVWHGCGKGTTHTTPISLPHPLPSHCSTHSHLTATPPHPLPSHCHTHSHLTATHTLISLPHPLPSHCHTHSHLTATPTPISLPHTPISLPHTLISLPHTLISLPHPLPSHCRTHLLFYAHGFLCST